MKALTPFSRKVNITYAYSRGLGAISRHKRGFGRGFDGRLSILGEIIGRYARNTRKPAFGRVLVRRNRLLHPAMQHGARTVEVWRHMHGFGRGFDGRLRILGEIIGDTRGIRENLPLLVYWSAAIDRTRSTMHPASIRSANCIAAGFLSYCSVAAARSSTSDSSAATRSFSSASLPPSVAPLRAARRAIRRQQW